MESTLGHGTYPALNWQSAFGAGIIAGAIFLVLEMTFVPLLGMGTAWTAPRMIAAIALGPEALLPASFNLAVLLVAALVHFTLSIGYAIIAATMVVRHSRGVAMLWGFALGVFLYVINFYIFTAVFPWFATERGPLTLSVHAIFGVLVAYFYKVLADPGRGRHSQYLKGPSGI